MKLTELFDNPIEPSSHSTNDYGDTIKFDVSGLKYELMISTLNRGAWEVMFDAEIAPGERVDHATGTGNEIAVFSTVNSLVQKFLASSIDRVRTLSFTSDLDSRSRLYRRIAAQWAKQFNMTLEIGRDIVGDHEFTLTNPNYKP